MARRLLTPKQFILEALRTKRTKGWRGMSKHQLDYVFHFAFGREPGSLLDSLIRERKIVAARVGRRHGGPVGEILPKIPHTPARNSGRVMLYLPEKTPEWCTGQKQYLIALALLKKRSR